MKPVYADYAATTPVDQDVAEQMAKYLTVDHHYGNPASRSHQLGWIAEEAVEVARDQLASLICADNREIVWTSGATEANNLAIKGLVQSFNKNDCHIISSTTEHKAVLDPLAYLKSQGYRVDLAQVDRSGVVGLDHITPLVTKQTRLVSVMAVNNETGVKNDIEAIAQFCYERGIYFHVDAAQALGKIELNLQKTPISLMSFSAHKFYGPKGVGALFVRRSPELMLVPQIHGGGHERGMRSGTLATHQIVGMGMAAMKVEQGFTQEFDRIAALQTQLWQAFSSIGGISLNGDPIKRVPHIMSLCFHDVDGESLLLALREVALSSGSACTSTSIEPSFVLKAMGLSDQNAKNSLRLSLGRYTTEADLERMINSFTVILNRLRT